MPVQPVPLVTVHSEVIAKHNIATKYWYALNDYAMGGVDDIKCYIRCMSNAANIRRRIERGSNLVVNKSRLQVFQ